MDPILAHAQHLMVQKQKDDFKKAMGPEKKTLDKMMPKQPSKVKLQAAQVHDEEEDQSMA